VDTWVDGYTSGIPGRKVSIYNEGAMLAWMMDVELLKSSDGERSLDDVMRTMYKRFGKRGEGYTAEDYWDICVDFGLSGLSYYRYELCEGTGDYLAMMEKTLNTLGWKLKWKSSGNRFEDFYGVVIDDNGRVVEVVHESPADDMGIGQEMKITSINGILVQKNAKSLFNAQDGEIQLMVEDKWREYEITVSPRHEPYKRKAVLVDLADSRMRDIWMSSRLPQ